MGDPFVADLTTGLVLKLLALVTEEVIRAWDIHQDLEILCERLESINALLIDAHTKKLTMCSVQSWFNKLEAVVHVADVFMDELAYEVTRQKVETHHMVRDFFIPSKNHILYRLKVAHKIKSIHTSFDKIFKLAGDLGLQSIAHLSSVVQPREINNTPPSEDESQIIGRDDDVSNLVQMMCQNREEELPVIAIVGMGGRGKTTLARMLYNRDLVIKMFPKRMWVTISSDFNFMRILNEMVESLTSTTSLLKNTRAVIHALQKNLKGETFLLVLDDVWNEDSVEWENLRNSLLGVGGARGSSILVTTRKQEVIDAVQYCVCYPVKKLSEQDSWALFKQRAFSHGKYLENQTFVALGRSMVERCGGLPLAIKALGGLLRSKKSEQEWKLIKDSKTWKSKDVLPSLRLSYDNLPYTGLKRCFAYCSILAKDSVIYKNELVHKWMALGFLLPSRDSTLLPEDIGDMYFRILLCNSLLQDAERDQYGNIASCKMHDLVHDLALDVSTDYSSTVMPSHDYKQVSKAIYVRLEGFEDVKTTIFEAGIDLVQALYAQASVFGVALPNIKHLRVLVISSSIVCTELPDSLGNLKYLKYLDIPSSLNLPNSITRLYNLQTLRVGALQELPKRF
ncbi:Disease resistance protein RGA2-like [Heracleum sosnowskyi]|uniref:Disease resistance protein RGA2-like n=1 Tax=Heracleum sosnowskyi TaxID=360622 RepID=A0AAD8HCF5_9APIA|nr:Disease resistance protein RGA2-like [Heracleum sosnowskyi]